ncbi:tumor necrosis factor receptor superfamily member 5 isoform X2 [Sinocyclocheilus anshuiensis]|uniref:tumor necrosis factor receptor superfamily member 5 isoform X2 n=1 Tax=Sinocyclocheilus anshuiensis TaxID=1608454 RepID=UPI0007B85B0B|nr:PREDICTED: tumor necrosis factor receptor superfamily member 5-like isoform X2 [Sinocyclocheilus anshuiensis]
MCHSEPSRASFFSSSKMLGLLSVLLLSSHVLPLVQSQQCDERTEYLKNNRCCKKCKPGQLMTQKCGVGMTDTQCSPCGNGFFMDEYNVNNNWCKHCTTCTKEHMKNMKDCTATSDAVCTCEEGYRCSDSKCQTCEKIQTTTVTTSTPSTKTIPPTHDMHDHVDGSCQHQSVSAPPTRASLDPVSAQRKRRYQCQCRRCVERLKNWRMSEKRAGRRPLMRLWIEYSL